MALTTTGKRRQHFNLYRLGQRPCQIFLVSHTSIYQDRTRSDHSVEVWIGPLTAGKSQGFSNRSGIDLFLGDARCGPGPSPVMKGNGHHCVSLKHALKPFRGG
jgi:hypothetical protein